ncbi:unnamed protein product [Phytophthora fragariaefolia]|uniref:Unnamed protein product n=1 Tax=Phytophthora fragariaefolia TaxID=1490495 RepID=A0A9W6Y610_9STRA|nr:unnamed protein product [Phytophthora fragariaefolia]
MPSSISTRQIQVATPFASPSSGPEAMDLNYAEDEEAELWVAEPTGEELSSGEPGGEGLQGLYNTERFCKPDFLVVQMTVKGFERTRTILVDSGASGSDVRRSTNDGSQLCAEALRARERDVVTDRLATGTRVNDPKVHMGLGVTFLNFDGVGCCLVLELKRDML